MLDLNLASCLWVHFLKADILLPSNFSDTDIAAWKHFNISTPGLTAAFLSYPYVLAAEKAFGEVRVCRISSEGGPIAFFPYQYGSAMHRRFRIGQRLAGELSDYYGIISKPGVKIDPHNLLTLSKLDAVLFTHLDETQLALGLSGQSPELGHIIDFSGGAREFWEARRSSDKKFVSDTERLDRRLVQYV